jgi:7-alpha-hydroxysteroid dehydrogenase
MLEQFRLTGQVAVITGAGRGIGAAIAELFGEAGADVVVTARTESQLEETASAVRARGSRALVAPGDITDLGFVDDLVASTVREFGRLDIVVNNAGGTAVTKPMLDMRVSDLEASFHFNVSVPFELSRLAVPYMLEHGGGSILNIGSVAGRNVNRGSLTHSLTKAALAQLTRLMAAELAPKIRVNAVLPGAIETDALRNWLDTKAPDARATMEARTPMRRNGLPEDVAPAVLYLVSPASSWVTGKLFEVDGGLLEPPLPSQQPDL